MAWVPAGSCRAAFEAFEAWQTAGLNALNNRGQWLECLLDAAAQRLRHLRPGKRQAWTPLTTEGSGRSACSKLPRRASNADWSRWLWPACLVEAAAEGFRPLKMGKRHRWLWPACLVEAAAEGFRPLKPGKRQLGTPIVMIVADGCGKPNGTGSTPAVVPGAAPVLAKAGVGGLLCDLAHGPGEFWYFFEYFWEF